MPWLQEQAIHHLSQGVLARQVGECGGGGVLCVYACVRVHVCMPVPQGALAQQLADVLACVYICVCMCLPMYKVCLPTKLKQGMANL